MSMPYAGQEFTFHNPDGSPLKVRGWGDQSAAIFETLDGHAVVKDPASGFYQYAALSADGQELMAAGIPAGQPVPPGAPALVRNLRVPPSAMRAPVQGAASVLGGQRRWEVRRELKRAQLREQVHAGAAAPEAAPPPAATVGNYVGLCLLVQFPDVPATVTQAQVDDFCNLPGYTGFGNNGSVRDYFEAVSDHKLHYTSRVAAYYTAQHPRAHYTDPAIAYGTRAQELIAEALAALSAGGFNFADLSADGAGFVYALNVFYAGDVMNNWAEGLWPHSSALGTKYVASPTRRFSDYQITHIGSQLTLRTFCHENGHMVCDFPDLYDTGYQSVGIGNYCLMCYGGSDTNPVQVGAYLKHAAGWTSKLTVLAPGMAATVGAGVNDFCLYPRSATEYFLLENRQQSGHDASLPDAGLAIWHVDRLGSNNNEQRTPTQHYECALAQADSRLDLELKANYGDDTDLYASPSARAFGADTLPASTWWDGSASGLEIEQISAPGASMHFAVRFPGPRGQFKQVFSGGNGVLYAVAANGDLLWYRHEGRNDGSFNWAAGSPKKVGTGWGGLRMLFSGGDGVIYAINDAGDLLWFRHDGRNDGSFTWAAGSPKKVGAGWGGLRQVFAGEGGVIYGIADNGDLLWYRHDGRGDGSFAWAAGSPKKVGVGWGGLRRVFAGEGGVIYAIADNGDLLWYRHEGRNDGSFAWAAGSPKKVGTGWALAGRGILYAIEPTHNAAGATGRLLWYRHDGYPDGSFVWAEGSPKEVGTGWSGLRTVFAGGDKVLYGINDAGDLLWYRHDGQDEGDFAWAAGSPRKVGVGWGGLRRVFSGGDGVLYAINDAGDLLWYRHDGRHDGSFAWAANSSSKVGSGWGGLHAVFSGGHGVIYAINDTGDLLWYRHDGRGDGSFAWAAGSPKKVGVGWGGLRTVFADGEGLVYAINDAGDLLWYRHDGRGDGSFTWAPGSPKKVGVGWGGLQAVFSNQ